MTRYEINEELWRRHDGALFVVRCIIEQRGDAVKVIGEGVVEITESEISLELEA